MYFGSVSQGKIHIHFGTNAREKISEYAQSPEHNCAILVLRLRRYRLCNVLAVVQNCECSSYKFYVTVENIHA